MLTDRHALHPDGPVRAALRSLRREDPSAADPAAATAWSREVHALLWQERLREFVASAPPELRDGDAALDD